jgi:hypothetical protein
MCIKPLGLQRDGVVSSYTPEICALLRYYTASNGNPLPTFRELNSPVGIVFVLFFLCGSKV